jgi:hypothetical protein
MTSPNPNILMAQLEALLKDPASFSAHREQIMKLSRRAAVVFDGPFETYRRFGYSVIVLS